ncbi:hypothetical protein GGI07_000269 [Coemansia sp. Benny D115]|nr:hypothetical protein GGI07_000269 [Coemansia sp. Benny D115]
MEGPGSTYLLDSFIEAIARITSYALTDREKESVVQGFRQFHQRLERISSSASLRHMALESKRISKHQEAKCQHTGKTCTQNCTRGFLKTFVIGYLVKYGLDIVPHLVSLRLFKDPGLILRKFRSRDTASFALFLSTAVGAYKAGLCTMRRLYGGSDYMNAMVAGTAAGLLAIKIDRNRSRRAAVTLYMVSRAMQYGCVWAFNRWTTGLQMEEDRLRGTSLKRAHSTAAISVSQKPGRLQPMSPRQGNSVRWTEETADNSPEARRRIQKIQTHKRLARWIRNIAPTALMSASCGGIVYILMFHTDVLPRGYLGFLSRASGYDRFYADRTASALKSVGHACLHGSNGGLIPKDKTTQEYMAMLPLASDLLPAMLPELRHDYVACGIFHPHTTSCLRATIFTILRSLPVAMKVYTPLNAAVLLLFKRRQLMTNPRAALVRLIKSSLRSSVFFALLVAFVLNGSCSLRAITGRDSKALYVATGLLGGLAVLAEQPSRRIELAMYCFLRAVENIWDAGVKTGRWHNIRHAEVGLFSVSMGILLCIYQNDPSTIGMTYHSILTRVFGKN